MKRNTLIIAWSTYIFAIILLVLEFIFSTKEVPNWLHFTIAIVFLMIPWFICINNAIRDKQIHKLWIFGLFFSGALVIPLYLIKKSLQY